jgi:itaconate CoA-transferase
MSTALEGIFVLAIEQAVAAPLCTVRLADAGARVVKIEREGGDMARHYDRSVKGTSAYFAWLNRGKESIVLDLKSRADMELVETMLHRADVFVQNLSPGAAARLGMGLSSKDLVKRHPRLIALDIVGYGQDTPYRSMRAYDLLVQAESGICSVTGTPDTPSKVGVSVVDIGTGMNAHAAILEALIERQRTGRGKAIEVSMFDSVADWMSVPLLHQEYAGSDTGRNGAAHASIAPYKPYACSDASIVIAVQNAAEWRRFCGGVLLQPELATDARFADNPARVAHRQALDGVIDAVFSRHTLAELIERLESSQVAWGRMSTVDGVLRHPALRRMAVVLPTGERIQIPRPAGREDFAPGPVPLAGADTARVRREFSNLA